MDCSELRRLRESSCVVTKTTSVMADVVGSYENGDSLRKRRPLMKTKTHYENEDPLRKRRPITKTKTHC